MRVREYKPEDLDALVTIFRAQGFEYDFPDLTDPLFVSKAVLEDDGGRVVMATATRLTSEAYLLLDPKAGRPQQRWQWFRALHAASCADIHQKGLQDVHAWLPPRIAKAFGRRLEALGWVRDDKWTPYCKSV